MPSYESTTRRMPADQPGLCALIQDTLPFYLEGDLSPESRAFIDTHLETCDRCASFLAGAQSIRGHIRREPTARSAVIDNDWRARAIIARGRRQMLTIMLAVIGVLAIFAFAGARLGTQRFSAGAAAPAQPPGGESILVPTVTPAAGVEIIPTIIPTSTPFLQPATSLQPTPTPVPAQP